MCNKSTVLLDLYKINSNMLYQLIIQICCIN